MSISSIISSGKILAEREREAENAKERKKERER